MFLIHSPSKTFTILLIFSMGLLFHREMLVFAANNPVDVPIAFSEILFLPQDESDSKWVEFINRKAESIDIGGWCITDFNGNTYEIPKEIEKMPPDGVLLIYFHPNQTSVNDDLSFQEDGVAILHCQESWAKDFISGWQNGCALYTSSQKNSEDIIDFVCWGRDNQSDNKIKWDALAKGLIYSMTGGADVGNDATPGDLPILRSGGSIGRYRISVQLYSTDWIVYTPIDISPGKKNPRPAPVIYFPSKNCVIDIRDGFEPFCIIWRDVASIQDSVRLQIALDRNFEPFIFNEWLESHDFFVEYKVSQYLYPGTFYCRVRFESPVEISNWSEVVKFTLLCTVSGIPYWEVGEK